MLKDKFKTAQDEWNESEHPRKENGQFSEGGSSNNSKEKKESAINNQHNYLDNYKKTNKVKAKNQDGEKEFSLSEIGLSDEYLKKNKKNAQLWDSKTKTMIKNPYYNMEKAFKKVEKKENLKKQIANFVPNAKQKKELEEINEYGPHIAFIRRHAQDEKIIDKNDYWLIENNPLTKIGVFPYLGRQISPELEPDKIYQVLRPKEELTKPETLKSLELIPLVDEHTMLGDKQGHEPAEKKGIHGVTGTNVNIDGDLITNDLKIYSETLKDEIKSGKKDLSLGYYCKYDVTPGEYNGIHYDAIQKDIIANHIALVEEGRMGKDVRVMDSITFDTLSDILENKENYKMAENEKQTQDVDKRELIREVMAIAAKPNEDFEGGEEEKIETIAKKLETMSYNPSEAGNGDEDVEEEKKKEDEEPKKPCKDADEDKRKLIDEIGGILNGKVDEEIVRTVMGKAEKLAEMIGLGVRNVSKIECGDNFVTAKTLSKIILALKIEPAKLFDFSQHDDTKKLKEELLNAIQGDEVDIPYL